MVSRENKVIAVFIIMAMILHTATFYLTELSFEVRMGLLMLIGVIAPMMINNYLDNQAED